MEFYDMTINFILTEVKKVQRHYDNSEIFLGPLLPHRHNVVTVS